MKRARIILWGLVILLIGAGVFFGIKFAVKQVEYNKEDIQVEELAHQVFQWPDKTTDPKNSHPKDIFDMPGPLPVKDEEEPEDDPYDYSVLKNTNEDCIGWVRIDGTEINYPVMWKQDDNRYYLNHDIYGNYATHGTPFLDGTAFPEGQLIIHGHNLTDGHFFASLLKYKDPSFLKEHPYITLYLFEEKQQYEIFAVCSFNSVTDYSIYEIPIQEYPEKVKEYIQKIRKKALYQTEIEVPEEDRLLILSTCEYSHENGRFIVIAHQIEGENKNGK